MNRSITQMFGSDSPKSEFVFVAFIYFASCARGEKRGKFEIENVHLRLLYIWTSRHSYLQKGKRGGSINKFRTFLGFGAFFYLLYAPGAGRGLFVVRIRIRTHASILEIKFYCSLQVRVKEWLTPEPPRNEIDSVIKVHKDLGLRSEQSF